MRCLLDENVHQRLVAFLSGLGHDARCAPKGLTNGAVFAAARTEGRVLLTHDTDFGERPPLSSHPGIVLLRIVPKDLEVLTRALERLLLPPPAPERFTDRLVLVFPDHHEEFPFRFEEFPFRAEGG